MDAPRKRNSLVHWLMIVPDAQTDILNFNYQADLYEAFHQKQLAQIGHGVCMTPIVFCMMALAAAVPVGTIESVIPVNGSLIFTLALIAWYLRIETIVGLVTAPLVIALCFGANWFLGVYGMEILPTVALTMYALAFLQAASHGLEAIPPPLSGSDTFQNLGDWFRSAPLWRKVLSFVLMPIFAILELISSPRLIPYQILRLMHRMGYRHDLRERVAEHAQRILATGDYNQEA